MRNRSRSWLYLRVSVAVILAGLVVGLVAESPATATNLPTTSVLVPANGATLSGTTATLDATASDATSVEFWIAGGSYGYGKMIGTATLTIYGYLYSWNTTTVPNGSYVLLSEAIGAGGSAVSPGVPIKVSNPLATSVLVPASGATLSGTTATLDASASNATSVEFALFGGSYGLSGHLVGTATPTIYGWLDSWNTTTVPNGSYVLVSYASGPGGSTASSGVSITVANPGLADLANSSFAFTASDAVGGNGCSFVYGAFDAVYPGSAAVGNVTLHIAGCVLDPYTYAGSFTITTGVGTLSGSATGSITYIGDTLESSYLITLSVTTATGSFSGTTGSLGFSAPYQTPQVASLTVG